MKGLFSFHKKSHGLGDRIVYFTSEADEIEFTHTVEGGEFRQLINYLKGCFIFIE